MKTKKIVYMVTYVDDKHKTHITFVQGYSAIRMLEERFNNVYFESTDVYPQEEESEDYSPLLKFMI